MLERRAAPPGRSSASRRGRILALIGVVAVCAVAAVIAVLQAGASTRGRGGAVTPAAPTAALQALEAQPFLMFRSTSLDHDFGRVALVPATAPAGPRTLTSLRCDRVDYANGHGICLTRQLSNLATSTRAILFDAAMEPVASTTLAGYPSRARVSPDGTLGATTTFVSGDSYATMGQFSTRTVILDTRTGRVLLRLDDLRVNRDGAPFRRTDFNFWGVTFQPDDRHFYATLGTGGQTYLIHGDLSTQTATVVTAGVECPSLSPDGTRIAFKQRVPGQAVRWRAAVLDLATLQRHVLADPRPIDDQIAWLDNNTVMYGLATSEEEVTQLQHADHGVSALVTGGSIATDTWTARADGTGRPQRLLAGAWSTHYVGR